MMYPVAVRDFWPERVAGIRMAGAGGIYHSYLDDVRWGKSPTSPTLTQLEAINSKRLSVKLSLYAYDTNTQTGRIVGTIGRSADPDDEQFIPRRVMNTPQSSAFGIVPWRLNGALNRITIDLGNALPESSPGGPQVSLGMLMAVLIDDSKNTSTLIGSPIPYDAARLKLTAGVEDIAVTASDITALATQRLGLNGSAVPTKVPGSKPGTTQLLPRLIMAERPSGIYLNAHRTFFRLSPGDTTPVTIRVAQFGAPKNGHTVALALAGPRPPASALTFPATATTSGGEVSFTLTAADPGHPRAHIDGQCYQVNFGDSPLTPSNIWGSFIVLVFDAFTAPKQPRWSHIEPIFKQYAHLYPAMKPILDLSSYSEVSQPANITKLTTVLSYSEHHARYTPVTRDLSPAKRKMILQWLAAGAPL
jgi:hypothetical protein